MALLCRYVKLKDRSETSIFTFIVTKSVTRDLHRDITSKEFSFGCQRWCIAFTRTDKFLGVYLIWQNPSRGIRVYLDFSFTLLNSEHFSYNESFIGKHIKFTADLPAQGIKKFISYEEMCKGNFSDNNGEYQLELMMSKICTVFDCEVSIPPDIFTDFHNLPNQKHKKFDSEPFLFSGFKWTIVTCVSADGKVEVCLQRTTGLEHQCHVKYYLFIGYSERRIDSGLINDISDFKGKGFVWCIKEDLMDLLEKNSLHLHLEILTANPISEVVIPTGVHSHCSSDLMDIESQSWSLEPTFKGEYFRFQLMFKDVRCVPRNHLRYIHWNAYLLKRFPNSSRLHAVRTRHSSYSKYYAQDDLDDGIIVETDVTNAEIRSSDSLFLDEKKNLKIHMEWLENLLLFQAYYHTYDDICRIHNQQMRREITILLKENKNLEKQIYAYQRTVYEQQRRSSSLKPIGPVVEANTSKYEINRLPLNDFRNLNDFQRQSQKYYCGDDNGSWSSDTEYA